MTTHNRMSQQRGFSLIEILIAVVVMSIGLLALANLQTTLVRESSQAKARSVGLNLAKEKLEEIRGYRTIDAYRAWDSSTGPEIIDASDGGLGGVAYEREWTVERFAWDEVEGQFESVANTGALAAEYAKNNEFKRFVVTVSWADATGAEQSISLEDAVGAIDPSDTSRVFKSRSNTRPRGPRVRINDPSSEAGVIPIAIGDGSETAATNPRPVVKSQGSSSALIETSYDIFTYAALNDGTARAQARVETSLVGCRCNSANAPTGGAFRPTVWNGTRYEPPASTPTALAGPVTISGNQTPQSTMCAACCRDHHDPTEIAGPKFSPRRSNHSHFGWTNGVLNNTAATAGQEYREACRLIRVDGIMRVAADPYNEFFNLLRTRDDFTSPIPDDLAVSGYQDFVIEYLEQQFVSGSESTYNTSLSPETGNALAEANGLNDATEDVERGDVRWLHSRGLYVDFLEEDAIQALTEAKDACDTDEDTLTECVLRVLPFTSINLTEISRWTPASAADSGGNVLVVTNNDFITADAEVNPVRGKASVSTNASAGGEADASAAIRKTSSGLAVMTTAINGDESTPKSDAQRFRIAAMSPCGNDRLPSDPVFSLLSTTKSTSATCDSPATTPTALRLQLRYANTLVPVSELQFVLSGPGGQLYALDLSQLPQDATSIDSVFTFTPASTILGGQWTLSVRYTGTRFNRVREITQMEWGLQFLVGGSYTVSFASYPFAPASTPTILANPSATCNPALSGSDAPNPYDCTATLLDRSTVLTVSNYNYRGGNVAYNENFACTRNNQPTVQCPFSGTNRPTCRNFRVASATNGSLQGLVGSIVNSGKGNESTRISFSNVSDDDAIVLTMEEEATLPGGYSCTYTGNSNNACSNATLTFNTNACD